VNTTSGLIQEAGCRELLLVLSQV